MNVLSDARLHRRSPRLLDYSTAVGVLYAATDLVAVTCAAVAAYFLVFGNLGLPTRYQVAVLVGVLLTRLIYSQAGVYESWRGRSLFDQLRTVILGWLGVMAIMILLAFLFEVSESFPRLWLFYWTFGGLAMLLLTRLVATFFLRRARARGWNHKRIVIIGAGEWGSEVMRRINAAEDWIGLDVICVLDADDKLHGQTIEGFNIIGGYDKLPGLTESQACDEVWICMPLGGRRTQTVNDVHQIRYLLRHSTVEQRLIPDLAEARLMNKPAAEVMGLPVIALNSSPMRGANRLIKDFFDRLGAIAGLVLLSPLLALIAIAIKLDSPGPVLFKQMRHGWDGRPIRVYKFRTMFWQREGDTRVRQATRDDDRVTRVGRWLRRTSLDELPQLFNVFQGKMSLVGPRPHPIQLNHYFMDQIDSFMQRHKVKPGITGWAQVNGLRGETDTLDKMKKRVEFDLYYIENWSLWFDVRIVLLTMFRGFVNENAY
ncbi:MAG: undecaprenyl-phosphate glucose phosphotransferase [Gammaproteobacteria bacterium]|nr:undecaprenyl-phosphate glucose phosphotransferase [Gammaproteobacteria bacterium]NND60156.1 undecaprenyl-phosphate glucose phosphotransferase [Gammaproteobacteria bacterium]